MKAMLAADGGTLEDLDRWRTDDAWTLEQKIDGDRLLVRCNGGQVELLNRDGEPAGFPIPKALVEQLNKAFATGAFTLDGEKIGSTYWVFDLMGPGLETAPWEKRRAVLTNLLRLAGPGLAGPVEHVRLLPTARTEEEKSRLIQAVVETRGEGFVAKQVASRYVSPRTKHSARPGTWVKLKLTSTVDVVVDVVGIVEKGQPKDNYGVIVYDAAGEKVEIGTVAWNDKRTRGRCSKGDVLEVVYLYTDTGGRLVQPRILRRRTDKAAADCTADQVRPPTVKEVLTP